MQWMHSIRVADEELLHDSFEPSLPFSNSVSLHPVISGKSVLQYPRLTITDKAALLLKHYLNLSLERHTHSDNVMTRTEYAGKDVDTSFE